MTMIAPLAADRFQAFSTEHLLLMALVRPRLRRPPSCSAAVCAGPTPTTEQRVRRVHGPG